jgi:hypothetical protein
VEEKLGAFLIAEQCVPAGQFGLQPEIFNQHSAQRLAHIAARAAKNFIDRQFEWIFHTGLNPA